MLLKLVTISWGFLMVISFLLGLMSPFFSGPRTIWKGIGLWGLGLGAGNAAVVLSFYILRLQGQERAALRAAGKQVPLNDMAGFGEALLASFGLMYFAALIIMIGIVLAIGMIRHRSKREAA